MRSVPIRAAAGALLAVTVAACAGPPPSGPNSPRVSTSTSSSPTTTATTTTATTTTAPPATTRPTPAPSATTPAGTDSPRPTQTVRRATGFPAIRAVTLRGDTRNSWAFARLSGGPITVEGSVSSHKAWSTSKVLVVAAFLETVVDGDPRRLTSSQRSLVTRALSASDMEALIALRDQIPGRPSVPMNRILRAVGDTRTVAPDTNQGGMQWAPVEQVRFLRALSGGGVVSSAASAYLKAQMNPIAAHEWGLGTVGATNFKGGWYRSDTVTRQMGFLDGYAVVLITDAVGPAVRQTDGDDAHVDQLNRLAALLAKRLRG